MNKKIIYFECICKKNWSDSIKINFIEGKCYICTFFSKTAITAIDGDKSCYTFLKDDFYTIFHSNQEVRVKKLRKINGSNL